MDKRTSRVHVIGDFLVNEYAEGDFFSPEYRYQKSDGYIEDSHSFATLEGAIVRAIAVRQEGLNTQAHIYFLRSIFHPELEAKTK